MSKGRKVEEEKQDTKPTKNGRKNNEQKRKQRTEKDTKGIKWSIKVITPASITCSRIIFLDERKIGKK